MDPCDILARIGEVEGDKDRIALIAYRQLIVYGWTSSGAIKNALEIDDPKVIGGFLSGLQRAGLIERAMGDPAFAAAIIVDPKPMFVPGPTFPFPEAQ